MDVMNLSDGGIMERLARSKNAPATPAGLKSPRRSTGKTIPNYQPLTTSGRNHPTPVTNGENHPHELLYKAFFSFFIRTRNIGVLGKINASQDSLFLQFHSSRSL